MNPDHHHHHQPRERSIPITTTQGNMNTTHFPLSSSNSGTSSGPFSNSPGRGNIFDKLNQFRNQHADEMFSDRSHFTPFGYPMSSASRNAGDFFSHGHRDEEEDTESSESHQPRVYNIPIQVETPEGVVPLARSNSHSPGSSQFRGNNSYHAVPSHGGGPMTDRTGETFSRQRPGPSPTPPPKPRFTPSYKPEPQGYTHNQYHPETHQHRVHTIPVQVEKTTKSSESVSSNQNASRSDRDSPRPDSQQSGSSGGPHVINIPVNNERQSSETPSQLPPHPPSNHSKAPPSEPSKGPNDPLDLIKDIKTEVCRLESEVNNFDGESVKQYRFLDEMLTRCMLKLDNIDSGGRDEVRSARKSTLAHVDRVIANLESKLNRPNSNEGQEEATTTAPVESSTELQSCEPSSSMEAETGEADSTQQISAENEAEPSECAESETTGETETEMEIESGGGSGQSKETIADQPDEESADQEAIEEEEEEEDPSGVDGSSKDFYNCSNNQLSNENICRTTEAVIIEEMDKEEPPEEPPSQINRSSEQGEKVISESNPGLGENELQGDYNNSSQPKIELPPDDYVNGTNHHSDDSMDDESDESGNGHDHHHLPRNRVSLMDSECSNESNDVTLQPYVESPDENSVSSKESDGIRESIEIVEEPSNTNNMQSSSPPKSVHA